MFGAQTVYNRISFYSHAVVTLNIVTQNNTYLLSLSSPKSEVGSEEESAFKLLQIVGEFSP